jgi:hypothetical protein
MSAQIQEINKSKLATGPKKLLFILGAVAGEMAKQLNLRWLAARVYEFFTHIILFHAKAFFE